MKRAVLSLAAALGLMVAAVAPAAAAPGDPVMIMVMKHDCAAEIQSEADFMAVEAKGGGNPIFALAQTVLACPAIANPGDAQSPGAIAGTPADFSFSITDSAGTTVGQDDATFTAAKLCESDINLDADGDGTIETDVCLDISHYEFSGLVSGDLTVTETSPPAGREFGTFRFTPTELQANNDAASLTGSMTEEPIELDTSSDTDNMVMLHVYNFQSDAQAGGGQTMPPTDVALGAEAGPTVSTAWPAILAALALTSGSALALAFAARRNRR